MYKIRTYNQIAAKGLDVFPRGKYEIASEFISPDAIMLRSQSLHEIELPESVCAVARCGAGVNNIPVADYSQKGVVVFNTPGANANAVKELVLAGMLLASRDIVGGMNYSQSLKHIDDHKEMSRQVEAAKKNFAGGEIAGKTLGVIGLGAIGSMVANMAIELGMDVVGFDPALSVEAAWSLSSRVERMENLQTLLSRADFITVHVPAIDATRHLLNAETLAFCKPGAVLLNFARESIVDLDGLLAGLKAGQLSKYVADFPSPELLGNENILLMPHLGASTSEAEENCAVMAANQLIDFLENGNIRNSVNFPKTRMDRMGGYRITICNENFSGVLGHVLSLLADAKINVIDMVNKSRETLAYNIIDVEQQPDSDLLKAIESVDGVVRVRLL
ncbi:phosphoglycerate dehydrogenase [Porticoccaceae bacterium LTM1]|nr:phosphoglycerate dehydrogenase [Porticoccaceae bacterium LTM1]